MTRYPDVRRALHQLARHGRTPRAVPLRELTPGDLVHVALTHPGGPQPEHRAEAERRIREAPPFADMALALTFARLRTKPTTEAQRRSAGPPARLRRMLRQPGGTMPRPSQPANVNPALLSRGVAYLPDDACEEARRTAEEMGYEVRRAGETER